MNTAHFPSIEAMVKGIPKTHDFLSSSDTDRYDFFKTHSYEDAVTLIQKGWPEGRRHISSAFVEITGRMEGKSKAFAFAEEGIDLDVGAFMGGEPECFVAPAFKEAEAPIRILVNIGASASAESETLFNRGAAICAIIDGLEAQGKRVELVAAFAAANSRGKTLMEASVVLKQSEQPLDMDRVAFCLCHPSMFRRFGFRIIEWIEPDLTLMGYGKPANADCFGKTFDIVYGCVTGNPIEFCTREDAAEWAAQQVNKLAPAQA